MDSVPVEIRVMIVRLLPHDGDDREALIAACPRWKHAVELEEGLWVRSLTYDPAGILGINDDQFLALFDGPKIRRRQFLREIKLECYLGVEKEVYNPCCMKDIVFSEDELCEALSIFVETFNGINERAGEAGLEVPPIHLVFMTATNKLDGLTKCSAGFHDEWRLKDGLLCGRILGFGLPDPDLVREDLEGVDQLSFRNHGLLRYVWPGWVWSFVRKLVDLRVLRLEFEEKLLWTSEFKHFWREGLLRTVAWAWPPCDHPVHVVEEIHVKLGRHSPRNEFLRPSNNEWRSSDFAPYMFNILSRVRSLTVLRLSGQFRVQTSVFDITIGHNQNPFPALTTFYLAIAPDTIDGDWFFVKDETEHAWAKAAADPEWASCVKLTKAGVYPEDPEPDTPPSDHDCDIGWEAPPEDEYAHLDGEPVKRRRTLPNDETMSPLLRGAARLVGRMRRIREFSLCLCDNFAEDDCAYPFVPPFITRKFELHYVRRPAGKSNPTLTWKLGQKVDHWRPEEDVLEAWEATAGKDSGLEMLFVE